MSSSRRAVKPRCLGELRSISLLAAFDFNIVINDLATVLADEFID
jgi:hypothetical protein